MDFLSGLALILLTLVGYSSGSVLGAKDRMVAPGIADLLVVLVLWVAALATRNALGKWSAIIIWIVIGLVVGFVLSRLRAETYPKAQSSTDEGGSLWDRWKAFSQRMGNYQSRVLMAIIYFTVVLPFGLGVRVFGDPLRIKKSSGGSNWQPKEMSPKPLIDEARRQF